MDSWLDSGFLRCDNQHKLVFALDVVMIVLMIVQFLASYSSSVWFMKLQLWRNLDQQSSINKANLFLCKQLRVLKLAWLCRSSRLKVKLLLLHCHPPKLRPDRGLCLWDSLNCVQSLPNLSPASQSETKHGQICHQHCHWNSTPAGFEPSLNQHLPAGSRHVIY